MTGDEDVPLVYSLTHARGDGWQLQIDILPDHGYRVIAPDLRGCGQSSKPAHFSAYSLKETCKDVLGLLEHLSVDKFILVGHDWGAALAWRVASVVPQRVAKLAVLSTGHPGAFIAAGIRQRQLSWYMLLFQMDGVEAVIAANNFALWRLMLQDEKPDIVDRQVEEWSQNGTGALKAGLKWYRANTPAQWFGATEVPAVAKLPMPVLGLWSTRDAMLSEEQMTGSARFVEVGKFMYKRVEAGHWMQLENPRAVNKALMDFFQAPTIASSL